MMIGNTLQEQLDNFMQGLKRRNPGEPEFHQAVYEVAATIIPYNEVSLLVEFALQGISFSIGMQGTPQCHSLS
ncbi:MAG: hypothetical protein ABFS56_16890 [Pseudomonadota bacterium]